MTGLTPIGAALDANSLAMPAKVDARMGESPGYRAALLEGIGHPYDKPTTKQITQSRAGYATAIIYTNGYLLKDTF